MEGCLCHVPSYGTRDVRLVDPKDSRLGVPPVRRCPRRASPPPGLTAAAKVFIHAAGIGPCWSFPAMSPAAVSGQLGLSGSD